MEGREERRNVGRDEGREGGRNQGRKGGSEEERKGGMKGGRKEGRMCVYVYVSFRLRPCCYSRGHSQTSHSGGPRSNPPQSMWDLRWTKWHWDRFFSEHFDCPCRYHSTHDRLNATLIRRTSG